MPFVGIDVGSYSVKTAIVDSAGVAATLMLPLAAGGPDRIREAVRIAAEKACLAEGHWSGLVFTGVRSEHMPYPGERVPEVMCDARGAYFAVPGVRTIIDIGAENARIIACSSTGRPVDFEINHKCAAGTGLFLDTIAKALEVDVADIGPLSLENREDVAITATCSVFAESEVVGLIARGVDKASILKAVLLSVANRIYSQIKRVGLNEPVALIGGGGLNEGLHCCLQERLGCTIEVPRLPHLVGAIGAALIAYEKGESS